MTKRMVFLLPVIFCTCLQLQSQTLYQPRNVKMAFENGTRALNGKPGPHYWQNHGNYNIDLTVTPPDRMVKGSEEITYFNDSPDTLKTIIFRLLMNYHKPEAIHYTSMDTSILTSGDNAGFFCRKYPEKKITDHRNAKEYAAARLVRPDVTESGNHILNAPKRLPYLNEVASTSFCLF